jgi:hypothetical protein
MTQCYSVTLQNLRNPHSAQLDETPPVLQRSEPVSATLLAALEKIGRISKDRRLAFRLLVPLYTVQP